MRRMAIVVAVSLGCLVGMSADSLTPLLLQKPTLSRTHIAFVYAGDLWTVPRDGGAAQRLTSGPGVETNPVYSPDGSTIAFTGEYDGNTDVYTVPGGRRRAEAPDVASRAGHGAVVDAGRQADPVRLEPRQLRAGAAALHDGRERQLSRAAAAAVGMGGGLLARRQPSGLRADAARLQRLEAIPRRRHHADLAGVARRLEDREDPARELERLQPALDRRQGVLPERPRRRRCRCSPTTRGRAR